MLDPALEMRARRQVYEAVCKYPGVHLRELSRTLCMQKNLVDYHLGCLERCDLVEFHIQGQFKRYFPRRGEAKDLVDAGDKQTIMLLRQPVIFKLVVLLTMNDSMSTTDMARLLRKAPSTISHHIVKLENSGTVEQAPGVLDYRLSDRRKTARILMSFNPQPRLLTNGFIEAWEDMRLSLLREL